MVDSDRPAAILRETLHRPWPLPQEPWAGYQAWENLLMAHWRVPVLVHYAAHQPVLLWPPKKA